MKVNKGNTSEPMGYRGIGIRRKAARGSLDVTYPMIWSVYADSILEELSGELFGIQEVKNGNAEINPDHLQKAVETLLAHEGEELGKHNHQALEQLQELLENFGTPRQNEYHTVDFITSKFFDFDQEPESIEDVYFRLQIISHRFQLPHSINLNGIFGILPTLVWTNQGPFHLEDFSRYRDQSLWGYQAPLIVTHVDKFPFMVNYVIPSGVRIADAARVRLGAYLGEGTTVMPAGYVNFNAGTRGVAMVEGRISAGVLVGENSDIGGGASIMGTLSGGNKHVIEIGAKCLIGANAGTGISLGFGCTIAAGTYVTAASKVHLFDQKMNPVDLEGNPVAHNPANNVVKAMELSGRDNLLFYLDTASGKLICRPNPKTIDLNPQLHAKNP